MPSTNRNFKGVQSGLSLPDDKGYIVLVGPNNSGKSSVLQCLNQSLGHQADYVSPRRFDVPRFVEVTRNLPQEVDGQKNNRKQGNEDWSEVPAPNPAQELVVLSNHDRDRVVRWHNEYFGQLSIRKAQPDNDFSSPEITVDGRPLTQQGSGSRAVLSLLTRLFDPKIDFLLIDEPEIGLEPQTQRQLYTLLTRMARGTEEVPKKQIIIATHSHLFLNRTDFATNFIVARDAATGAVAVRPVASDEELASVVFRLLGNSPSDLFFPRNILVVEGPSDATFFHRLFHLRGQPDIVAHYANGDSKIDAALPAIEQMLKTTSYLRLYRRRICVVVDVLRSDRKRLEEWRAYLGANERVVELSKNGIEHYYPVSVLAGVAQIPEGQVLEALPDFLKAIAAGEPAPSLGSFTGGKRELAQAVAKRCDTGTMGVLDREILDILELVERHADWSRGD